MSDDLDELVAYNDDVTLTRIIRRDEWQNPVYGTPEPLKRVRIDRGTVYSGTNNDRQVVASATIYVRTAANPGMPELSDEWLGGQAEFDGRKYAITSVTVLKDADKPGIWGYELEVL